MAETATHPLWCARRNLEFNDHDLHRSTIERIAADFPSDMSIHAYLMRHRKPLTLRNPEAVFAALEFFDPASGPDPVTFQLTFGQLRYLSEALSRLVRAGG